MVDSADGKPKWGVLKRLEFIEFRLFWYGRLNRAELADAFQMSPQQASGDIAQYQSMARDNLAYDPAEKAYLRTAEFRPILIDKSSDRFLLQLLAVKSDWISKDETWFTTMPPLELVSLGRRPTDAAVLLNVLDAVRLGRALTLGYRSMSGSTETDRRVVPHSLASASGRWYVRAWSEGHNDFRDYNLSRIEHASLGDQAKIDTSLDYEWHQIIDLVLSPNPLLPAERFAAVSAEYNMVDGGLRCPVRLSLSFYLMTELNLDVETGVLHPEKQQLVLLNKDDVISARRLAREMSKQALARAAVG